MQGAEAAARNKRWSKPTAAPAQAVEAEAARKRRWWSQPTTTAPARAVEAALALCRRRWRDSILHSNTSLGRRCKCGSNFFSIRRGRWRKGYWLAIVHCSRIFYNSTPCSNPGIPWQLALAEIHALMARGQNGLTQSGYGILAFLLWLLLSLLILVLIIVSIEGAGVVAIVNSAPLWGTPIAICASSSRRVCCVGTADDLGIDPPHLYLGVSRAARAPPAHCCCFWCCVVLHAVSQPGSLAFAYAASDARTRGVGPHQRPGVLPWRNRVHENDGLRAGTGPGCPKAPWAGRLGTGARPGESIPESAARFRKSRWSPR